MEELENLTQDDILEIIKDFPIELSFNNVLLTTNYETNDELDLTGNKIAEVQFVVAAGPSAHYQAGDRVKINLASFVKDGSKDENGYSKLELDLETVNNRAYIYTNDRVIKFRDLR